MVNCFGLSSQSVAWLNKYYPIPAERVTHKWTWAKAAKYSLLKWKGLRTDVLDKYNLKKRGPNLYDGESGIIVIDITNNTCHLCARAGEDEYEGIDCFSCPFVKLFGKTCCNRFELLYQTWVKKDNPEPMIKALEKIYKVLKRDPKFMSKK